MLQTRIHGGGGQGVVTAALAGMVTIEAVEHANRHTFEGPIADASAAGVRSDTATASQGLLFMDGFILN